MTDEEIFHVSSGWKRLSELSRLELVEAYHDLEQLQARLKDQQSRGHPLASSMLELAQRKTNLIVERMKRMGLKIVQT